MCNNLNMNSYSSFKLDELLKTPNTLNIDNKKLKLNITFSVDKSVVVKQPLHSIFVNY